MMKTYTVIFSPGRWWNEVEPAWTQVKVEAKTYADARDLADEKAKEVGNKNGHFSWRLEERLPHELTKDFMQQYKVSV